MSDKDMKSTGSENVSKRKFLKKAGATAGAMSSVTLVTTAQADRLQDETVSPDSHCSTETVASNEDADCDCIYCWKKSVGGYSTVTAKLYLSNDPNGEDWGDFKIHNSNSGNGCSGDWHRTKDITSDYVAFQIDSPDDILNIQVYLPGTASEGTFDLYLEKCQ